MTNSHWSNWENPRFLVEATDDSRSDYTDAPGDRRRKKKRWTPCAKKLLQERAGRMPKTFQQRQTRSGVALEFAAATREVRPDGKMRVGQSRLDRLCADAALSWSWIGAMVHGKALTSYTLSYADGQQIARGDRGSDRRTHSGKPRPGGARLVLGRSRTCPQLTQQNPTVLDTTVESGFDWRLSSGASVPSSWSLDEHWLEGRGQRINIPLDETTRRVGNYGVALVDPVTGWAFVSDVTVQAP